MPERKLGFVCVAGLANGGKGVSVPNADAYSFLFELNTGRALLATDAASNDIKARYVDNKGHKVGSLVSQGVEMTDHEPPPMTKVPEPSTLLLFGSGLAGFREIACKRHRQR